MRNAESRNPTGDHPRTRRARIAPGEVVSASVQPGVVPACLREDLPQRRLHDARRRRGDRGRHEPGEDPGDHRCAAIRALSMDPGPTCLHRQERVTGKASPAGSAHMVGQAAAGSDPLPCWKRITSRSSPTAPTVSGRAGAVTLLWRKYPNRGVGQHGSSREISPSVSIGWITQCCAPSSPRTFATIASCG
jgi:hypothetical protein